MRPSGAPGAGVGPGTHNSTQGCVKAEDVFLDSAIKSVDTFQQVEPLLNAIKACTDIEELHLQGFSFGKVASELLGNLLAERGSGMKHAFWSDIFVSRTKEEVPIALSNLMNGLIKSGAKLYTLDLSNNAFGAQGVQSLVQYFKSDLSCNLEDLNLTNTGLGIGGAKVLSAALSHVKSKLQVIRIGRNRLENEGSIALAEIFKKFTTIKVLEMPQNGIYFKGVEALAEALAVNNEIEEFIFSDNTVTPKGAKALKKVLPKLKSLERLYLDDCLLKNQGAKYIFEALISPNVPALLELNLSSNELSDNVTELPIENAIFWRSNLQFILRDNRFSKIFREWLDSRIADCEESQIFFGEDEDIDDGYEDEDDDDEEEDEEDDENDEDDDIYDDEDEEDEEDVSQHTSDEEEQDLTAVMRNIPATINQGLFAPCNQLDEVVAFLKDTSKENFLKLGTKPVDTLVKHLQGINDEDEYTDELVQMIFKLNVVDEDPKELLAKMKSWEEENSHRSSILANAFLVHLGVMKSENKKKQLCGKAETCVKSFAKVLNSPDISSQLRDMILFVVKDKCSKEKKIGEVDSERFLEILTEK